MASFCAFRPVVGPISATGTAYRHPTGCKGVFGLMELAGVAPLNGLLSAAIAPDASLLLRRQLSSSGRFPQRTENSCFPWLKATGL